MTPKVRQSRKSDVAGDCGEPLEFKSTQCGCTSGYRSLAQLSRPHVFRHHGVIESMQERHIFLPVSQQQ